jgi:hypothetical protein
MWLNMRLLPTASGLVCGGKGCVAKATVWLESNEEEQYQAGERIFELTTCAAKVRVQ